MKTTPSQDSRVIVDNTLMLLGSAYRRGHQHAKPGVRTSHHSTLQIGGSCPSCTEMAGSQSYEQSENQSPRFSRVLKTMFSVSMSTCCFAEFRVQWPGGVESLHHKICTFPSKSERRFLLYDLLGCLGGRIDQKLVHTQS